MIRMVLVFMVLAGLSSCSAVTRQDVPKRWPATSSPVASYPTSWPTNCWQRTDRCGMPGPHNTGVMPGTSLRPSGSLTVTHPGTRLAGLDIHGSLVIKASDVLVENCVIHAVGGIAAVSVLGERISGVRLVRVEIDGGRLAPSVVGIRGSGFVLDAANIHGTGDAVDAGSRVVVRNSWIHDLIAQPGDHTDGIQTTGGTDLQIVNNTIDATGDGINAAIIAGADLAPMDRVLIEHNLLDGGNYTVYAGSGRFDSGDIQIRDNDFGSRYRYGPCSYRPSQGRVIHTLNNVADGTGQLLAC